MKVEIDIQKLFEIAGSKSEGLVEELYEFNRFLNKNYKLKVFLEDNKIKPSSRKVVFKDVAKGHSKLFKDLICLLIEVGLVRNVPEVAEKFTIVTSVNKNIEFAELKVPKPIEPELLDKIKNFFGGNIRLKVLVDPAVIGGFVLRFFDGKVYDASLQGRLSKLRAEIAG